MPPAHLCGAEGKRSRGAEEQRSRGAEEQRSRGDPALIMLMFPFSLAPCKKRETHF
jgi:hypothetical protein